MAGVINKCSGMTGDGKPCVLIFSHEGECRGEGEGWGALQAAAGRVYPAIIHNGDLTAIGIYIVPRSEVTGLYKLRKKVVIGVAEDGSFEVLKGKQTGKTIEALAESVSAVGGKVSFSVGCIKISV